MCSWGLQSITKSGIRYRTIQIISTGQTFPSPLQHQPTAERGYLRPWASRNFPDETFKLCFISCMSFAVPRGAASDIQNAFRYSMNTAVWDTQGAPPLPSQGKAGSADPPSAWRTCFVPHCHTWRCPQPPLGNAISVSLSLAAMECRKEKSLVAAPQGALLRSSTLSEHPPQGAAAWAREAPPPSRAHTDTSSNGGGKLLARCYCSIRETVGVN